MFPLFSLLFCCFMRCDLTFFFFFCMCADECEVSRAWQWRLCQFDQSCCKCENDCSTGYILWPRKILGDNSIHELWCAGTAHLIICTVFVTFTFRTFLILVAHQIKINSFSGCSFYSKDSSELMLLLRRLL